MDGAVLQQHLANALIPGIGDIEIARCVEGQRGGSIELSFKRARAISRETEGASARKCGNDAIGVHLQNTVVSRVGYIRVPLLVEDDRVGIIELRACRRSAIATVRDLISASERAEHSIRDAEYNTLVVVG